MGFIQECVRRTTDVPIQERMHSIRLAFKGRGRKDRQDLPDKTTIASQPRFSMQEMHPYFHHRGGGLTAGENSGMLRSKSFEFDILL